MCTTSFWFVSFCPLYLLPYPHTPILSPLQLQIDHSNISINVHLAGDLQLNFVVKLPSFLDKKKLF